jgi:RHS repeat-associated protein
MNMTSTMSLPTAPNKNLYNGGSEWQNDFSDQPDWQQTFYRNYDQTIGRFLATDPMAEATNGLSIYQYANNNPVMFNDPLGNLSAAYGRILQQIEGADQYRGRESLGWADQTMNDNWTSAMRFFVENGMGDFRQQFGAQTLYNSDRDGTLMFNDDGVLGTYQQAGLGFFRPDHAIVKDENGVYGNAYPIFAFVPLKANTNTNQGGQIFGTTLTTQTALSSGNIDSFIGKYLLELKYTQYSGVVNEKAKGIVNFNTTIRNRERSHDVSLDIGKFSFAMGLTSRSVSYDGLSFNFDGNIFDGITYGVGRTDKNGNIIGSEYTINPFKIIPAAAAAAYYTSPYWVLLLAL